MPSRKRIIRASNGVVLTEVTLPGPGGPDARAYAISSKRTPEVWTSGNLPDAERLFMEELARCQQLVPGPLQ